MADHHTPDFKREAVSFYRYSGKTLEEVAGSLRIPINTLEEWLVTIIIDDNLTPTEKQTIESLRTIMSSPPSDGSKTNETFFGTWMEPIQEDDQENIATIIENKKSKNRFQAPCFKENSVVSELGKTLGEGGMGIVHSATQNSMGRRVAVKEIRPQVANPHTIRTLLQEAWITGFLEHPNIVPVYDISENERDEPIILMKQISGKDWATFLQDPELVAERNVTNDPLMWHLDVFDQVCNAVHYAHSRGILHRDLKPENIMIGDYGEVYVLDWGIALALDDRHSSWIPRASEARHMTGSPWYMAPEMLEGDGRKLSVQTDVYLLGAILYELVTGTPPHKGPTLPDILKKIPKFEPTFTDDTCLSLQEIIRECLELDPKNRPKCVNTLRKAVQTYKEYREINQIVADVELELDFMEAGIEREDNKSSVYSHYFAARFGLEQIRKHHLKTDHLSIEETFHQASLLLIEWALKDGRPESALLTLKYLRREEPECQKRIEEMIAQKAKDAESFRKLEIARSQTIGVRTRSFVMLLVILGWVTYPVLVWGFDIEISYRTLHIQTALMQLWLFAIGIWARHSLSSTEMNKKTYGILLAEPLMHLVADMAAYSVGWSPEQAWSLRFLVWTTMLSSYAILVELRLIGIAFLYGLISVAIFAFPEYLIDFSVGVNLLLFASTAIIFRPALKNAQDARELDHKDFL